MSIESRWVDAVYNDAVPSKKRLILIAGASGSGKSHSAKQLVKGFNECGHRALHLEADMYYKGISRIIVQKALMSSPYFKDYVDRAEEIADKVRDIIKFSPFGEKMCKQNYDGISALATEIMGENVGSLFGFAVVDEFKKINFDEPFALNFDLLVKDMKALEAGQDIILPDYSFATGEVEFPEKNLIHGSDYDFIVVEGLYTLRPEVLKHFDRNNIVTNFIDCEANTLLARRLNRDIKSGRTSMTPQEVIVQTLTQTMPSYFKHIEPTIENADKVIRVGMTMDEKRLREPNSQVKYRAKKENLLAWVISPQIKRLSNGLYVDRFYQGRGRDSVVTLRLREVNGEITELTFKMGSDTRNRRIEKYDLTKILSEDIRNLEVLESAMNESGFENYMTIYKKRHRFLVPSAKGGYITASLDAIMDLGFILEFENASPDDEDFWVRMLKLDGMSTKSYKQMYEDFLKNPKPVLAGSECTKEDMLLL